MLILRDSIQINRPPEAVWRVLEDPERMSSWNPNVRAVTPISWGGRTRGFRYQITYALSGRKNELSAEIEEYQEPVRLVIHLTGGNLPRNGYFREVYDLSKNPTGTLLTQTIQIHHSGINPFFRWVIWLLHRFGWPTGMTYLAALKDLVERGAEPPPLMHPEPRR